MMPKISFVKPKPVFDVESGANLMQALLDHEVPVASSCRGDGVCAKCVVRIVEGAKNLTPETDVETMRKEQYDYEPNQRLSCQAKVIGDVKVDTPYW